MDEYIGTEKKRCQMRVKKGGGGKREERDKERNKGGISILYYK